MTRLRRYQRKGVFLIRRKFKGRALIADEMGLGKSLQALTFMDEEDAFPTIICCPAALKWNWEREITKHLGMYSEVLEGRKAPRRRIIDHRIVIINYDILSGWVNYLKRMKAQLLIVDEAHSISNPKTKRSKAVKKIAKDIPYLIACDGTPLTNKPKQLFPVLHLICPEEFPAFRPFGDRYCQPQLTPWGMKYDGATRIKELHRRLRRSCMIRRLKREVAKDLPPKTLITIPVDIDSPKEYAMAKQDFIHWIRKRQGSSKANVLKKSERMSRYGYLKRLAAELKFKRCLEWIETFLEDTDEKLVVFGIHKAILQPLHDHFKGISVRIDGSITGRARQNAVDAFQMKASKRLLFGNIKAAGVGADYTSARSALFVELPWTPGRLSQAIDRLHRLNQSLPVFAYFLLGKDTIEEMLWNRLGSRQNVLDAILDGEDNFDQSSIFDALERDFLEGVAS